MATALRTASNFPQTIARVQKACEYVIVQETLKGVRKAVQEASVLAGATAGIKAFNESFKASANHSRSLASTNVRLAAGMQDAVLTSYAARVTARKKLPSYRIGDRYSGGALRRALGAPGMFVGTYNGIAWGDVNILSQEAKHWARLNYGAGGAPGEAPVAVDLTLFGQSLGVLSDPTPGRAGFSMPKGIWVGEGAEGGKDFGFTQPGFYPTGKDPNYKSTKGIGARRYFDAAFVYLGAAMQSAYEDLMNEWENDAANDAKSAPNSEKVVADA